MQQWLLKQLSKYFYGIRLTINKSTTSCYSTPQNFWQVTHLTPLLIYYGQLSKQYALNVSILSSACFLPRNTSKPPGSILTFQTERRGHITKPIIQDYHLTGQPIIPLKNFLRKNAVKHKTDISNNSPNTHHDTNHKQLWSYIKYKRQDNFGIPTLKDNDGTYNIHKSRANVLNNYFSTIKGKHW